MILEFCRSCLQPELRRFGQQEDAARTLKPVSLDSGRFVIHLCGACRARLTIAEVDSLRRQPEAWERVLVAVEVTGPDGGRRSDTIALVEPTPRPSKPRRGRGRRAA